MIFNTSDGSHWGYRIVDMLKATMATPTYFPLHKVYQGVQHNEYFLPGKNPELFIDGGIFANDPELAALCVIGMQWEKPANYHLLSVGTGCFTSTSSSSIRVGCFDWIFNKGFLVNTLVDRTRCFAETAGENLTKSNNMKRMKLNYKIIKRVDLDDRNFVRVFDEEWEYVKNEADFQALLHIL